MDDRINTHDSRRGSGTVEWRRSSTGRPLSTQSRIGNGGTDWNSDWLTDGVAVHLQALHRSGASLPPSSVAPDDMTIYQNDGLHNEIEPPHHFAYQLNNSTISVIPEERCDSRTSAGTDPWQDVPKHHEAVAGLIRPELSPRHVPSPDCQPSAPRPRSWAERVSSNQHIKRLSGGTSKIIKPMPGKQGSIGSADGSPIYYNERGERRASKFSERLKTPPSSEAHERDSNIVLWDGPGDPENPINWPRRKKWITTFALGSVTFCVTLASSIMSPGTEAAALHFGVSPELMVLSTALFILGFAFGPMVWGPCSEVYGRCVPMFDFWAPADRGIAASVFSGATFLGPTMGPIIGGFLAQSSTLTWRWSAWITLFAVAFFGPLCWLVYDESLGSVLLQRRAKRLRHLRKNWALHAPADEVEISVRDVFSKYLTKPVLMLVWEPILLLITIYISFIYGILYLFFETYPISFIQQRGWSLGVGGLPFIAVMLGVLLGCLINYIFIKTRYVRILKQHGRVAPEERLVPMMVGSILLPIGLFWFAWTSDPKFSWVPQVLAGVPVGAGILLIFLQGINYIIDVYKMYSNSAIAGNTIIRSLFGAGFPMFAMYMYRDLGVAWATSVLGFISVGLIPVPILFFVYGARIRKLSKFTPKM